jgi:putative aldouronate transport system permease protein
VSQTKDENSKNINNEPIQIEENLSEILQVRREKLAKLQEEGKNPFEITSFHPTHYSNHILENFVELEGQDVTLAGRIMSKRIMGKASFTHILDSKGQIQLYVQVNELGKEAYLLLTLPMVLLVFVFNYLPMAGIVVAFKNFRYDQGIFGSEWVGLRNFEFFFKNPDAKAIILKTLGYNSAFIIINLVVSVGVALLLYQVRNRRALKIYQTTMFIPYFLSWVVVAYMAYAFLNPASGMLNRLLVSMGREKISWYTEPSYWVFILPVANTWKSLGFNSLIYYASLMGIDPEYFEAATLEGANKLQVTWHITIPFLYPLMTILTILAIGGIFSADFGLFFQLPMDSKLLYKTTDVVETYLYRALAVSGNIDTASATGLIKSIVGFVCVVSTNLIVRKMNPENALF